VRVRNIKPKGKQLPVAILKMADDDDDDDEFDDDDDDDGNEFYDEEGHAHEEDEDVTMDDDLMPEDELGALSDADDDQSGVPMGEDSGRHTMARLKADLFGEDDADDRGNGLIPSSEFSHDTTP
jgi:U3 small nucleolar RNA-associated protein MPP10